MAGGYRVPATGCWLPPPPIGYRYWQPATGHRYWLSAIGYRYWPLATAISYWQPLLAIGHWQPLSATGYWLSLLAIGRWPLATATGKLRQILSGFMGLRLLYTDEHLNFPLTRVSNTRFLCPTANCGRNSQSNTSITTNRF
jgi:hypothetical protein